MQNLPPYWIHQLKEEESERRKSQYWVKMTNTPDVSGAQLKEALTSMGCQVREVRVTGVGFLILAADRHNQLALESMSGYLLGDHVISISRFQPKMSGDEILGWMEEHLRIEEEVKICIASRDHSTLYPPSHVPKILSFHR
jgi:hypothetical protein